MNGRRKEENGHVNEVEVGRKLGESGVNGRMQPAPGGKLSKSK